MPTVGSAQIYSTNYYKITGLVELDYTDYSSKVTTGGQKAESSASTFMQRYRLSVDGFIKTPKLAVYSASVGFTNSASTFTNSGEDTHSHERGFDYGLFVSILPFRPISLDVYATRSSGTVSDGVSLDNTTNTYGLALRAQLKDLLSKTKGNGGGSVVDALPLVILRYDHYDFDFENITGRTSSDMYNLDLRGIVKSINTRYLLGYEIINFSTPGKNEEIQTIRENTFTTIKRSNYLNTSLLYTTGDDTKVMIASADLSLNPSERFSQEYSYRYYGYEAGGSRSDTHDFSGSWSYLFTNRFRGRATAAYSLITTDGEQEDIYLETTTLNYYKAMKDFNFSSNYGFSYRHSSQLGEIMGHTLDLELRTRNIKWGTVYADYGFTYDTQTNAGNFMENIFRLGVQGRGPGRAYWTVEGNYTNITNNTGNPLPLIGTQLLNNTTTGLGSASYYGMSAELGYPVGRNGLIYLQSSYARGIADASALRTMYYEARLNYNLFRNLSLVAWWRQGWDRDVNLFDRKITEFEGRLYYRLRRLYLSVEYRRWKTTDPGPISTEVGTLFLRLTRPI